MPYQVEDDFGPPLQELLAPERRLPAFNAAPRQRSAPANIDVRALRDRVDGRKAAMIDRLIKSLVMSRAIPSAAGAREAGIMPYGDYAVDLPYDRAAGVPLGFNQDMLDIDALEYLQSNRRK